MLLSGLETVACKSKVLSEARNNVLEVCQLVLACMVTVSRFPALVSKVLDKADYKTARSGIAESSADEWLVVGMPEVAVCCAWRPFVPHRLRLWHVNMAEGRGHPGHGHGTTQ